MSSFRRFRVTPARIATFALVGAVAGAFVGGFWWFIIGGIIGAAAATW